MGGLTFNTVSAGGRHSCGIMPAGAAYCWGRNAEGQLGDGTVTSRVTPVPVAGGLAFASVSAGVAHTCGVTTSGALFCWGRNLTGQLGDGTTTSRSAPVVVDVAGASVASVSAGSAHTCAVTMAGAAYCWGRNLDGALGVGDGSPDQRTVPTAAAGGHAFATIAAGRAHTCGVTTSQVAYCWGQNDDGELGDGTDTARFTPAAVSGGGAFVSVSAVGGSESGPGSDDYSCGLMADGTAWCWGSNASGQLGTGGGADTNVPAPLTGGHVFDTVRAGSDHACGLSAAGVAYCWGADWGTSAIPVQGQQ
jgi:alpha-tubulin suppressor-like RCC1 family protein